MNCDDFRSAYLEVEDAEEAIAHLSECGSCRSRKADLDLARQAIRDPAVWEEPPATLENQVVALISGAHAQTGAAKHRPSWRVWAAAAAAAVVVVLAAYGLLRPAPPNWEITMPGTDLAPVATSTVTGWNTDSGTRMVLDIAGLEHAPEGYVYELWLSSDSLHVSAGSFVAGGTVNLGTGVRLANFPRLWVTLEPLDDDESPSGHTLLDTGS